MADDIALSVKHLSKDFILPHERKNTLKEWAIHFHKPSFEKLHALHDIDFEVKRGEFFGIVGRNGSGKSTLLKIIGGIYQPTKGELTVNGTLTPFIELGIGFNPELTGRENIFLNGAILGLTHKEIKNIYNEVVAFAELEKFMDQKLKNYSSGMQVRLAFSIAIQAHNDILLIDEVLAVGDSAFQRKCFNVFKDIKRSGRTVIFVTHDMGAVQEYCDRALMIQDSEVLMIGKPREIALKYEIANAGFAKEVGTEGRPIDPNIHLERIKVLLNDKPADTFALDEDITVTVEFTVNQPTEVQFNVSFVKSDGTFLAGLNTTDSLKNYKPAAGKQTLTCKFKSGQIPKGAYFVNAAVYTYDKPIVLIDILDINYGVETPRITMLESSLIQSGEFYIQGQWTK